MKLAIMQPYLFPYLGYFSLIEYADYFIFFDTPQYISHGWINRNRILKADGGVGYFIIPIEKTSRDTAIKDIKIDESQKWRESILGQLTAYKRRAPYYKQVVELCKDVFDFNPNSVGLSDCCERSVKAVCEYIGLERKFDTFSKMNISMEAVNAPDEWALNISDALGAKVYVNPPGGQSFFDKSKYDKKGIQLEFLEQELIPYIQRIGRYEAGLSILDVMMFNNEKEILDLIKQYHFI